MRTGKRRVRAFTGSSTQCRPSAETNRIAEQDLFRWEQDDTEGDYSTDQPGGDDGQEKKRETGLEPATATLGKWNSTTELLPLAGLYYHKCMRLSSRKRANFKF